MPNIKGAALGEDAEWRVVYYHAIIRIFRVLIIATRIEWSKNEFICQIYDGTHVLHHSLENILWREAIVCRFWIIREFSQE